MRLGKGLGQRNFCTFLIMAMHKTSAESALHHDFMQECTDSGGGSPDPFLSEVGSGDETNLSSRPYTIILLLKRLP